MIEGPHDVDDVNVVLGQTLAIARTNVARGAVGVGVTAVARRPATPALTRAPRPAIVTGGIVVTTAAGRLRDLCETAAQHTENQWPQSEGAHRSTVAHST